MTSTPQAVDEPVSGAMPGAGMVELPGMTARELRDHLASIGEKPFRAQQLMKWLYHRLCDDFSQMTDLPLALRERLANTCSITLPAVALDTSASDGTRKWLFRLADGNSIETVFIPESDRGTLCVSSQVGCALDCSFCSTGRQGFNRNLSASEIIMQLWLANRLLAEDDHGRRVTNVVMMGMGEPLANFRPLVAALELMLDDRAFGLSKRRVTVSTSGIVPAMDRLTQTIDVSLAVSLHAPNDTLRDELVPLNRKYPLAELMGACRRYVDGSRKKHVLFEYVMLHGVNDTPAHATELASLLKGFPAKVNLIPFNPFPQSGYRRSDAARVRRFADILINAGVLTLRRATRGDDIDAACGQLAGKIQDRSRRAARFTRPRYGEQFQ